MSEPSATPEPLRRRRSRDRAAGGAGEDDSWAHLVGVEQPWGGDGGQPEQPVPPPSEAETEAATSSRRDRVRDRATEEPPLSRRAARRREAEVEAAAEQESAAPRPAEGAAHPSTGGVPLHPWWASSGTPGEPAAAGAGVPSAFLRPEARPEPPVPPRLAPQQPPAEVFLPREQPPAEVFLPREQPQVNPWPGQVRPALPLSGAPGSRLGPPQRTSDVAAATRARPEPPDAPPEVSYPRQVVLPADPVSVAGPPTGPLTGPITGPHTPAESHAPMGNQAPFGAAPVLPAPELPGPVLPGVEPFTEPPRTAGEPLGSSASGPGAAPLRRRRARTAAPPEPTSSTGTIYLPTTAAAGAAPETDLHVVPAAPATPPQGAAGTALPTVTATSGAATAGARRRRLSAPPTRFPALGPTGEVVDVGTAAEPRTRSTRPARPAQPAPPARPDTTSTPSTFGPPLRGRRTPPAGFTPAAGLTGLTGLPSVSGPATGSLGSGGLSLPAAAAGLPGTAASAASAGRLAGGLLGANAAAHAAGAGAAGAAVAGAAGAAGSAATGALDVVAGLGRAGHGSRRPDAGRLRGRSVSRTALRSVENETDDDLMTRTIAPVPSRVAMTGDQGETPSPRRSARNAETALSRALAGDETTITPGVPRDETGATPPVRPVASGGVPGGAGDGAAGQRPDIPTRRSVRTGQTGETPPVLAAVPAAPTGRAGRNLPAAIAVGVGLAAAVIASLLFRKEAFVLVVAAAVLVALWELSGALRSKRIDVPVVPLAVGALGMLVSAFVAGEDGLLVSFALTAFGVLLWRIIDGHDGATRDVAAAVFVAAYVPFLAGFAMLMLAMPDGAFRVLVFVAVTVSNDVGGYATGVLAGRHPMAPTISPKKSWEGMAGSAALCMIVGALTVHYLLHGSLLAGLAVGAAAAVTATIGDLSESLIKRDLGIKDMGNLLPGHGGIMDRLDSLLPTAPAVYLLLLLLVPVY